MFDLSIGHSWPWHFALPLDKPLCYYQVDQFFPISVAEHAVYSPAGKWGVLTSHENHAVIGGPSTFVEAVFSNLEDSEDFHLQSFLSIWKDNRERLGYDVDWLLPFFTHLYGQQRARKLLKENDLL